MIPDFLVSQLAVAADTALLPVLKYGATYYGQTRPTGEVGFVAAMILAGVPALARAWVPILRPAGYQLRINGVFCHQTPQATFTDLAGVKKPCELADLLVVVDDLTAGRRWAALIQAKVADTGGGTTISGKKNLRQLDLYKRWPPFTLPADYDPRLRDFSTCTHGGALLDCGWYGLIEKKLNPDWHQQAPAQIIPPGGYQLGSFLAHMVRSGQSGFGREATGTMDDWSRTVQDLMQVTYTKIFNYAAGFGPKNPQQRQHMAVVYMSKDGYFYPDDALAGLFGRSPPPSGGRPDYPEGTPPESLGISILRIGIEDA